MKNTLSFRENNVLRPRTALALMVAVLAAPLASATTNTWTGAAGDQKWSTSGNWLGGVPTATDDALFLTNDAVVSAGTVNNIVDASLSIQSLTFRNTNTWHTMQIDPNVSLTITGSVASPLFVGTGVDSGGTLTVNAAILGSGSLLITNSSGVMNIRQGSPSGSYSSHRATLDMSGLANFTAYVSRLLVAGDGTSTAAQQREGGTLYLAQTNLIVCSAGSATPGLGIADGSGNASSGAVYLGQTNVIFSDGGMFVGYRKSPGVLSFGSTIVDGSVLFRDRAGTGRQNQWWIGYNNVGGGSTVSCNGNVNFNNGTVDALVNTVYVGRGQTAATPATGVGTLTFSAGTIDVNTLQVGYQSADGATATGTVNVDGAARLIVNNNLELGHTTGTTALPRGTLNVGVNSPGGSVWIKGNVVESGSNGDSITLSSGQLKVGGTLGTASLPLQNMTLNSATLTFDLGGAPNPTTPLWQVGNLTVTAPVTNNVVGSALSLGQFTLIKYASIVGDDGSGFVLGSLPPRLNGYLSNNTANLSIDLVITNAAAPKWAGNVNSDWDINITTNWVTLSGNAPTAYLQDEVPGDPVLFDDTATGPTSVNLTTTLSPASITVTNSSKDYTFTGLGRLSGPARLNKSGSATLTISNTGTNDFAGAVTVAGGKVTIAGSADRLPTNSAVTLADSADAALDLNNLNQTLGSLSGGGASGGNVSLGTGTLTLSADGGVYDGVISGSGMVVKSGTGAQVLAGANVYGGGTLITGGTLVVANTNGSGTGPGSILVATTNAALQIGDGGADGSVTASTITNQGWVLLNRSDDFTLTKLITGGGGLQQYGTNVVTIPTANTYTGLTYIQFGALRVTHPDALGDTTGPTEIRTDPTARLELAGGITLVEPLTVAQKQTAAGGAPAIRNVSGTNTLAGPMAGISGGSDWTFQSDADKLIITGPFTNLTTSGVRIVRLRGAAAGEWFSDIGNSASSSVSAALIKNDAGTWTLWGRNTYNGNTTISGGLLVVNGQITGSTNISVTGGALGGTGLITAPVTIATGATLSPGASIGTLTISNRLTFATGSTADFEVSKNGPAAAFDQVRGLTSVTYGGTLKITLTGALNGGEVFRLFSANSYSVNSFDAFDLPPPPTGLSWDLSQLTVDGTLRVLGGNINVTQTGRAADGNFLMSGTSASTNEPYRILATTNLTDPLSWIEVGSGTFTDGVFSFTDINSTNYTQRFYRVVMP